MQGNSRTCWPFIQLKVMFHLLTFTDKSSHWLLSESELKTSQVLGSKRLNDKLGNPSSNERCKEVSALIGDTFENGEKCDSLLMASATALRTPNLALAAFDPIKVIFPDLVTALSTFVLAPSHLCNNVNSSGSFSHLYTAAPGPPSPAQCSFWWRGRAWCSPGCMCTPPSPPPGASPVSRPGPRADRSWESPPSRTPEPRRGRSTLGPRGRRVCRRTDRAAPDPRYTRISRAARGTCPRTGRKACTPPCCRPGSPPRRWRTSGRRRDSWSPTRAQQSGGSGVEPEQIIVIVNKRVSHSVTNALMNDLFGPNCIVCEGVIAICNWII